MRNIDLVNSREFNSYKVSFEDIKFKVINCSDKSKYSKMVICNLVAYIKSSVKSRYPESRRLKYVIGARRHVTGIAYCSRNDEFNERLGKTIARTKAEMKARRTIKRLIQNYVIRPNLEENIAMNMFLNTLNNYNQHDEQFIESKIYN